MKRWRVMRSNGRGSTTILSDNLPMDMAEDLVKVLNNGARNGNSYFSLEYEEARQHKETKVKPHIEMNSGLWLCGTKSESYWYSGHTPVEAYQNWLLAKERNHG